MPSDLFNDLADAASQQYGNQYLDGNPDNGQEFLTTSSNYYLGQVEFNIDVAANASGSLTALLYSADSDNVPQSQIATLGSVNNDLLSSGNENVIFDFNGIPLSPNTAYYVVLEDSAANAVAWNYVGGEGSNGGTGVDGTYYVYTGSGANQSFFGNEWLMEAAACYCRGVRILTDKGEVAVENLAIGDKVIAGGGVARPIKWIGRRAYGGRFAAGKPHILPIVFKAGSLAEGIPRRDLIISPHHAVCLEGVLIEARFLVNGVSIVQVDSVESVEYFHIELESHDLLVAEGALCESFLDDDCRNLFQNAHEYRALYPVESARAAKFCAQRRDAGAAYEAAARALHDRARAHFGAGEAGALRGFVDALEPNLIAGWARDEGRPETAVLLEIVADGRIIGLALANRFRADLQKAGLGRGLHGFSFVPPEGFALDPRSVKVRRVGDGATLKLTDAAAAALPRTVGKLSGYIDLVGPERICGWARDEGSPDAPVRLEVFAGGRAIGRLLADQFRDDLKKAGLGDGRCAFTFVPPENLAFAPHAVEVRRAEDGAGLALSDRAIARLRAKAVTRGDAARG